MRYPVSLLHYVIFLFGCRISVFPGVTTAAQRLGLSLPRDNLRGTCPLRSIVTAAKVSELLKELERIDAKDL